MMPDNNMWEVPSDRSGHSTILVVDDDAPFRERLVKALATRSCLAYGASNVSDGLALAQKAHPPCSFY